MNMNEKIAQVGVIAFVMMLLLFGTACSTDRSQELPVVTQAVSSPKPVAKTRMAKTRMVGDKKPLPSTSDDGDEKPLPAILESPLPPSIAQPNKVDEKEDENEELPKRAEEITASAKDDRLLADEFAKKIAESEKMQKLEEKLLKRENKIEELLNDLQKLEDELRRSDQSEEKSALFFTSSPSYSIEGGQNIDDEEFVVGAFSVASTSSEEMGDFKDLGRVSASKSGRFTIRDPNLPSDDNLVASYDVTTSAFGRNSSKNERDLIIPLGVPSVLCATKKWTLTFVPDNLVAGDKVEVAVSLVGASTKNDSPLLVSTEVSQWSLSQLISNTNVANNKASGETSMSQQTNKAWWKGTVVILYAVIVGLLGILVTIILLREPKKDRHENVADPGRKIRRSPLRSRGLADSNSNRPILDPDDHDNVGDTSTNHTNDADTNIDSNPFTVIRRGGESDSNLQYDDLGDIDEPPPQRRIMKKAKIPPPRNNDGEGVRSDNSVTTPFRKLRGG